MKKITFLITSAVCLIFIRASGQIDTSAICTVCNIHRQSFTIDNDWKNAGDWAETSFPGVIKRKICFGDVVHAIAYLALSKSALLTPISVKHDIPVRLIGPDGELKGYEKDFLYTALQTNLIAPGAGNHFTNGDLVNLWNYVMKNIYLEKAAGSDIRVEVDFSKTDADPKLLAFNGKLPQKEVDLIEGNPQSEKIFENLFDSPDWQTNLPNGNFYVANGPYFSHISWSVEINAVKYKNKPSYPLSLWSIYDWYYSNIFIPGMNPDQQKFKLKLVKIKGQCRRFFVSNSGENTQVTYNNYEGRPFINDAKHKRYIKEDELRKLFPNEVKRLRFKK